MRSESSVADDLSYVWDELGFRDDGITKDGVSCSRLLLEERDLSEENRKEDLSCVHSVLSVRILHQNEDIAGAQLTDTVPKTSA